MGLTVGDESAPLLTAAIASKGDAEAAGYSSRNRAQQFPPAAPVPGSDGDSGANSPKPLKVKEEPIRNRLTTCTPEPRSSTAPVSAATPANTVLPRLSMGKKTRIPHQPSAPNQCSQAVSSGVSHPIP